MKICLPAILVAACLAGLFLAGCESSSPHEGMINYNHQWITVEEYERIKGSPEPTPASTPTPAPTPTPCLLYTSPSPRD